MRGGKAQDALPYFRQAASLAPADPGAQLGLAQCLEALGGTYLEEATKIYRAIVKHFSDHPVGEMAEQALTRLSQQTLRERVGGGVRMDAVMYMQSAIERFAQVDPAKVGRITVEIAMLGRNVAHQVQNQTVAKVERDTRSTNTAVLLTTPVSPSSLTVLSKPRHRYRLAALIPSRRQKASTPRPLSSNLANKDRHSCRLRLDPVPFLASAIAVAPVCDLCGKQF